MQQATMSMTAQALDSSGNNPDDTLLVKFFNRPMKDEQASKEEGRPIYKDVVHIDIRFPGDKTTAIVRKARQKDMDRFPRHLAAFRERMDDPIDPGYPLSEWTECSRSEVEELAFFNIKTVEQLANVNDGNTKGVHGMLLLRDRAKNWLIRAGSEFEEGRIQELEAANAEQHEKIVELTEQVTKLIADSED